jgi:hypothetical protein
MNRKDALNFLGLPDSATDKQLRKCLEEKIEYYERLSQHAPSAFLKRLNAQHLARVQQIQKQVLSIQQQPLFVPEQQEPEVNVISVREDHSPLTMPVILNSSARVSKKKPPVNEPVAFLVRHTENQSIKPFTVFAGKNYIGRKPHETLKPFIALEDDEFVSRIHAVIFVEAGETVACFIDDSAGSNEGKASKNGTFLNGDKMRISARTPLKENDTIQIGETKLIFRLNTANINKIVKEVQDRDYMHTVVIRR